MHSHADCTERIFCCSCTESKEGKVLIGKGGRVNGDTFVLSFWKG